MAATTSNWLRVKTEGTISNRDGIGAFIKVTPDVEHPESFQVWEIRSGDSYLSQSEMTAHFGLGDFDEHGRPRRSRWPTSGISAAVCRCADQFDAVCAGAAAG